MSKTTTGAWLLVALFAGCLSGNGTVPVPPEPEVTATGPLSLQEDDIAAFLDGSDLGVSVVLRREGEGRITGKVRITVVAMEDASRTSTGEAAFSFDAGAETVPVRLAALPDLQEASRQATVLVRYRVESNVGTLMGTRSLFVAMPKESVVLMGPKTWLQGEDTAIRLFARNPVTGAPLADKTVQVEGVLAVPGADGSTTEVRRTATVTTDSEGLARVTFSFPDAGTLQIRALSEAPGGTRVEALSQGEVVRLRRVLVTTDKPLYQPGQEMHLRVLALRKPALRPDAGAPVRIEVMDAKGNKVFKALAEASEFGIASARMRIAHEVNLGTWKVRVTVGDTVTEKAVTVDRYSLPKFRLDLALDRPWYLVGGVVKGQVSARYFFGKPVAGGTVKLVLSAYDVEFSDFATLTGTTSGEGLWTFETRLPTYLVGQPLEQGKALVKAAVEVTDTAGQVVAKQAGVLVAQDPLSVVLIPESGVLVPEVENRVFVFVEDPAGQPVKADVTVKVGEEAPAIEVGTDATGIGEFLLMPEAEALILEATARDAQGATATARQMMVPGASGEAVLVRTDRALYRVGETMTVTILAPDGKDRIYLDLLRQGQLVRQEALDLKDARATAEVDLDGQFAGDLVVSAFYLSAKGRIIRDQKVVFVQGADGLRVDVEPSKETYAPADEARIGIRVTGSTSGDPVVAALGLQVVDEAVYALSENQPGLLRTWFELEDAIREPKYEIHGASFPVVDLVTGNPEDPEARARQDRQAQAAFAAMQTPEALSAASSWDQDLKTALSALTPFYQQERERVLSVTRTMAQNGQVTWDNALAFLKDQKYFYDFFGNLYRFDSADGYTVTMTSRGPDEREGTADDWQGRFELWEAINRGWEAEDGAGGGPVPGAADATASADAGTMPPNGEGGGQEPRVRNWFPETLYVNPQVITGPDGRAEVSFPIADSITEWRLSALANSPDGRLGSVDRGIRVFQPFFVDVDLPRTMTRGDEISFPVAVYNYLETPQTVRLQVEAGPWAELAGDTAPSVAVDPGAVKGVSVTLRAGAVGWHGVLVRAYGDGGVADAVMRTLEVLPDGIEVRGSDQGRLTEPVTRTVTFPAEAIPGTPKVLVKVFPGVMAQVVEGLDSILQMPSGCFEQTTATLWPDALVLQYAALSGKITPEIELKAREFVTLGYQRLLTFECTGGGFTWFGDPNPPNLILSAMGVMEFTDIGAVMDIDEAIVPRTASFLAGRQAPDGSWHETQGSEFATVQYDDLMTTCFIGWALGGAGASTGNARSYIASHLGDQTATYALALCANALAVLDPNGAATDRAFRDLEGRAVREGDLVHWTSGVSKDACWYGGGEGTDLEATALAALALMKAGRGMDLVSGAIGYLASKKDSFGNWGSTHATILALKAFTASLSSLTQDARGLVTLLLNGEPAESLEVTPDNADVFFQFDLSDRLDPAGANVVDLRFDGEGTLMYQVVWSHYVPGVPGGPGTGPLEIEVVYDKTDLAVNDAVGVTATVRNVSADVAPMVLVDLGMPPGFDLLPDGLERAVKDRQIQKFETTDRQILVYVDALGPGQALVLQYQLRARYPLKVQCPQSTASLYYDASSAATATCPGLEVR